MDIPQDRVRIAFLGVGESKIELVEPTDDTTGVARFLASKGEGFHHVCFEVDEPVRNAAAPGARRAGAHRQRAAPRRRGSGGVHPSAVVPRRARRADRGARRAVLGRPRVLRVPDGVARGGRRLRRPEREHQGQLALGAGRQTQSSLRARPPPGSRAPGQERVLHERLDAQPGVDERGDDLAQAVVPAVLDDALADVRGRVRVGAGDLEGRAAPRCSQYG